MGILKSLLDFVLHLDKHLSPIIHEYGAWTYLLLFAIVFCETGLVVTPFLPGDSLLFVAGAIAAVGGMDIAALMAALVCAALLGDNVNYWAGRWLGLRVFARFINQKHLERAHTFYERHGGKTIVLARFVPIVRTYAPFVAGVGRMPYARYLAYCVGAALLWVVSMCSLGYFFGNIPAVRQNLTVVILGIVLLSISPGLLAWLRSRARPS
jgi:membrane-associated protein